MYIHIYIYRHKKLSNKLLNAEANLKLLNHRGSEAGPDAYRILGLRACVSSVWFLLGNGGMDPRVPLRDL